MMSWRRCSPLRVSSWQTTGSAIPRRADRLSDERRRTGHAPGSGIGLPPGREIPLQRIFTQRLRHRIATQPVLEAVKIASSDTPKASTRDSSLAHDGGQRNAFCA